LLQGIAALNRNLSKDIAELRAAHHAAVEQHVCVEEELVEAKRRLMAAQAKVEELELDLMQQRKVPQKRPAEEGGGGGGVLFQEEFFFNSRTTCRRDCRDQKSPVEEPISNIYTEETAETERALLKSQ
jgi:hypothetical protein